MARYQKATYRFFFPFCLLQRWQLDDQAEDDRGRSGRGAVNISCFSGLVCVEYQWSLDATNTLRV